MLWKGSMSKELISKNWKNNKIYDMLFMSVFEVHYRERKNESEK